MQPAAYERRGSTLVEVLAASAVLAVAMGFLAQFVVQGVVESSAAQMRARAVLMAQARMEELRANRADLQGWEDRMRRQCEFDADAELYHLPGGGHGNYRWEWAIEPAGEDNAGLRRATVRVRWRLPRPGRAEGAREFPRSCSLVSLVMASEESTGQEAPR